MGEVLQIIPKKEISRIYQGINLDEAIFTSRSAVECWNLCNYKRYLEYFYDGVGIVPSQRSIPLTTGNEIHKGIEYLLSIAKFKKEYSKIDPIEIDNAVSIGIKHYHDTIKDSGLYGKGTETDLGQKHTFEEQKALIEALIRAWAIIELPDLMKRFNILHIEKEIIFPMGFYIGDKIAYMQTKCDAVFQEKSNTKEHLGYSLKSQKTWNSRAEKGYRKDLQGVIEKLGIEYDFSLTRANLLAAIRSISNVNLVEGSKIISYLSKQLPPERIMGIRFCFLIKGDRREDKSNRSGEYQANQGKGGIRILSELPSRDAKQLEAATNVAELFTSINSISNTSNLWFTDSPLIYGYKKITPSEILYAHSDKTIKPENKSGFGKLGKGWEWFKVWEDEQIGFVKGWIDLISRNKIQSELGNLLEQIVYRPLEFYRSDREIERRWRQTIGIERMVLWYGQHIKDYAEEDKLRKMDEMFPQNTHSCHFPVDCEYLKICFGEEPYTGRMISPGIAEDPIGSGEYIYRTPHHEGELVQIKNKEKKDENNN